MINTISCTPGEALQAMADLWDFPFTLMLWGPPGVGKSAVVRELAARKGVPLIDVRLSQKVASDIGGLPALDHTSRKTTFYLPDFLPDPERDGPQGILFLDELPGADDQTRIAAYGLLLERRVAAYDIPAGWRIIAAGNRPEDDPANREFGSALNDRLVHFLVEPTIKDWLEWAETNGIHPEILAFLSLMPQFLVASENDIRQERAIVPSPRSWERVSRIWSNLTNERSRELATAGLVGDTAAHRFFSFCREVKDAPSIEQILNTSLEELHTVIPTSLQALYLMAYGFQGNLSRHNAGQTLHVIARLDNLKGDRHNNLPMAEIQRLAFTLVVKRALSLKLNLAAHPAFKELEADRAHKEVR